MACGDVLSLEDLQTAKKHQIFEAEVITGKAGGVAGGASIDYATNQVTGQTQKTLPAVLRDAGFRPASFTFATGGALAVGDSDAAVLWPVSAGGDGQYYIWKGAYPKVIPAGASPATTGGVSDAGWLPLGDVTLRDELASANEGEGDVLLAVKQPATGVQRTQHDKNADYINIRDFGGVDDFIDPTGTNNKDAFAKAITHLNGLGGGVLRLPHVGTGVYFIDGDDPTQVTTTIRLDPEPGVSIRLIYSGGAANSPLVDTELQTTRQLPIYFANFGFTSFVGSNVTRQLGEILPTVNNADGVYAVPEVVGGSAFKIIALANPNTAIAPVSSAADAVVFAGAGTPRAAILPAMVGDEVQALISSPLSGVFFAGVITANGYAYVAQDSGDQTVKLVEGVTGLPGVWRGIPYAHTLNQQRDNFNNALVSVRVTSSRSFSVLVNGLVVYSYTTRSSITAVAFGTENISGNISVSQMSRIRQGRTTGGSKALRILMVGDSITDNSVQYSHAKYLQMLLGSAGVSVAEINNIAVAGQTAAQQYAILQTVGSGYDIACIQVGVNDAQGGTNFASFISTISDIVNYCKNIGAAPIVAPPTAFYSRAEAIANGQPGGQNTANNDAVHTYRALLIRAVASAGGFLNMETMKGFGAMSAKWLSIVPYSVSDRLVVDNIHPSPYGSMMLAQGWARSIIGWLNRPDSTKAEAFETIASSWLSSGFGLIDKPTIRSRELKGVLSLHATVNNDGAVAFVLPPAYLPDAVKITPVVALNSSYLPVGPCSMYIGTNGNVYFFNLPGGTTKVQLDSATL